MRPPPPRLWLLLLLAVTAAAYAGVAGADYLNDDRVLITTNPVVLDPTWRDVFLRDLWCCGSGTPSPYWRPLTLVSFLIDRVLFDNASGPAHLVTLGWHLAAVVAAHTLLRGRVGEVPALVGAAIFALHPIQSETVAWVLGRNDSMAAVGVLGALAALDRGRAGAAAGFALLAAGSKETGFTLPVLFLLWQAAWAPGGSWGERARTFLPAGVALVAAALLRAAAELGATTADSGPVLEPAAVANVVVLAVSWVTWPWPLTNTAGLSLPFVGWWTVGAAGAAVALAAGAMARSPRTVVPLLVFAAVAVAPAAGGVIRFGALGERYLYLGMFGVAATVAATIEAGGPRDPRLTWGALAAFVGVSLVAIGVRVPDWANGVALFGAAVERRPDAFALAMYAHALEADGEGGQALPWAERSLDLVPARRLGCGTVGRIGGAELSEAEVLARLPRWGDRRCRELPDFDLDLFVGLVGAGKLEAARAVAATSTRLPDPGGRDRAAWARLSAAGAVEPPAPR